MNHNNHNENIITVSAVVAEDFLHCLPDLEGKMHQHFYIRIKEVLEGDRRIVDAKTVFVAVHYGDEEGLPEPIPCLTPGEPIIIRGQFIPAAEAYQTDDNPCFPVLHYTHHPVGYVIYDGVKYE